MSKRIPDEILNLTLAIEFLKQEKLRKHWKFLRDLDDTFEPLHVGRKTCWIVALTLPAPLPDKEKKLN